MGQAKTFIYREDYRGRGSSLPSEISPRPVNISDFSIGRERPVGQLSNLADLEREFSVGLADYGMDYTRVYSRQRFNAAEPGFVEHVRVFAADALIAESTVVATDAGGTEANPIPGIEQFHMEAIAPGAGYNSVGLSGCRAVWEVTRKIASGHPLGPNTPVFKVSIYPPDRNVEPEQFEDVVVGSVNIDGTSAYHRTRDAGKVLNDDIQGSKIMRFVYEPTADGTWGRDFLTKNDVSGTTTQPTAPTVLTLMGGDEGTLEEQDWLDAIEIATANPFRWLVIPNAPSEDVRGFFKNAVLGADYGVGIINQMYGEGASALIEARKVYGTEAQDGKCMMFWGWGEHISNPGVEVSYSAAYMGRYSAKIAERGLGGEYPVGNDGLGYRNISKGHELTGPQQELFASLNINYCKKFNDGSYGVHGFWTLDELLDRMGDISRRVFWNDVIRRLAIAYQGLAQSGPNNVITRKDIKVIGDDQIQPYITVGYAVTAQSGIYDYGEVSNRFAGLSFPYLDGNWAYYLLSVGFAPTLGGIYAYLTDQQIAGLANINGATGTAAGGLA